MSWAFRQRYSTRRLRLAVQALMLVRRGKKSVEVLVGRVRELQNRLAQAVLKLSGRCFLPRCPGFMRKPWS